ncbi:MAG TPA: GNAT family N-acetyltransferase [Chitinophagaceae bacterium]|nr:GNAT family N-acetyltransferase [Chitinophagaceae bacterium]
MIQPSLTNTIQDLKQILQLQEENLAKNIDETEIQSQGFVTLRHDLNILEQMHGLAPSIIIKDDDKVVAYALTMLRECRQLIPDLEPMFALIDKLSWCGKPLNDHSFYVMGQVCVAKPYRGQGLFDELYKHHKKIYQSEFDLIITEIATRNQRSIRAHERVGFKTIHTHQDELDEWSVVGWDWN